MCKISISKINSYHIKLIYLNFHPLEVVFRYRDPQPQVAENYSYLFNLDTHICKSGCLDTHFIPNNSDLITNKIDKKVVISRIKVNPGGGDRVYSRF